MPTFFGRRYGGYRTMNTTNLIATARRNLGNGRYGNVARALRILQNRNLTNNQRANLIRLATKAAAYGN